MSYRQCSDDDDDDDLFPPKKDYKAIFLLLLIASPIAQMWAVITPVLLTISAYSVCVCVWEKERDTERKKEL